MTDSSNPAAPAPTVSTPSSSSRASDIANRLRHLRNLLYSERHENVEQRLAIEALDREMLEMSAEPVTNRLERRRRILEAQTQEIENSTTPEPMSTGGPASILRSQRRAVRPSERLQRHRERYNRLARPMESLEERPSTAEDTPVPRPVVPADMVHQEYLEEAQVNQENRWRAKRRKLDDGTFEEESSTFSYGHKGQVIEGRLKLKITSCDGGEYSEPNVGISWPGNVLQDDNQVYCTKSNRCNMIFKHVGGMPFSLTKVVIKAPREGYNAPIQEGMIFVSMNDDKLLETTSQYEIQYSPRSHRYQPRGDWVGRYEASREYAMRHPLRSIDRSNYLRNPSSGPYDLYDSPLAAHNSGEHDQTTPVETSLVPGFDISTSYDDETDFEETDLHVRLLSDANYSLSNEYRMRASTRNVYGDPRVPPWMPFSDYYRPTYSDLPEYPETDNEDQSASSASSDADHPSHRRTNDTEATFARQRRVLARMRMQQARDNAERADWVDFERSYRRLEAIQAEYGHVHSDTRRLRPSRIEVRSPEDEIAVSTEPALTEASNLPRATKGGDEPSEKKPPELLAPHARFFIRKDKSSVSIKFDPPVAGRVMLIKLWAPCPNANIDIQSINAYGYGGPRFFPAQEFH